MIQVSTDYGVLCSETSLVAVERLKEKVEGEAKPVVIPIAITKDSQQSYFNEDLNSSYMPTIGVSWGASQADAIQKIQNSIMEIHNDLNSNIALV